VGGARDKGEHRRVNQETADRMEAYLELFQRARIRGSSEQDFFTWELEYETCSEELRAALEALVQQEDLPTDMLRTAIPILIRCCGEKGVLETSILRYVRLGDDAHASPMLRSLERLYGEFGEEFSAELVRAVDSRPLWKNLYFAFNGPLLRARRRSKRKL